MVEVIGNFSKRDGPVAKNASPLTGNSLAADLDSPAITSPEGPRRIGRVLRLVLAATFVMGVGVGVGTTAVLRHTTATSRAASSVSLLVLLTGDQYRVTPHWELDTGSSTGPPTQARISVPMLVVNTGPRTLTIKSLTGTGIGWAVHTAALDQAVAPRSSTQLMASLSLSCPRAATSSPLTTIPVTIAVQTADHVDRRVRQQLSIGQVARQSTTTICTTTPPLLFQQGLIIPTPGKS